MSFIEDSNEIARQLRQKRMRKNPARGNRVVVEIAPGALMMTTEQAAAALNRKPQTLRVWAMVGHPIAPVRIHGRLAWRVADVEALLNGETDKA
jgi:hypothetical protein